MNIVVTGATSFLGAALCKELVSRGHQVYAVVPVSYTHLTLPTNSLV